MESKSVTSRPLAAIHYPMKRSRQLFLMAVLVAPVLFASSCKRQTSATRESPTPAITSLSTPPQPVQDTTPPEPDAIVFDLSFRGIKPHETHLWAGSATGWGRSDSEDSKYLKRLQREVKVKLRSVHNPHIAGHEWCALEIADNKVQALHIDLNGNDRPDDGERIMPSTIPKSHHLSRGDCTLFFTGDMELPHADGTAEPYQMVMRVQGAGDNCPMWSSAALWVGATEYQGVEHELMLFDSSLGSGFRNFGRARYALAPETKETTEAKRPKWQTLSRIIHFDSRFLRLRFLGSEAQSDTFQLVLEPYDGATGKLQLEMVAANGDSLPARCSYMRLKGESTPGVYLSYAVTNRLVEVPSATYELNYASLSYGADTNASWSCRLSDYSGVTVGEGDTRTVPLGPPAMAVVAIDADRRYSSDIKPATEFPEAMRVYISPEVTGPSGEKFSRFCRMQKNGNTRSVSAPSLRITDKQGKEVVAKTLEYG